MPACRACSGGGSCPGVTSARCGGSGSLLAGPRPCRRRFRDVRRFRWVDRVRRSRPPRRGGGRAGSCRSGRDGGSRTRGSMPLRGSGRSGICRRSRTHCFFRYEVNGPRFIHAREYRRVPPTSVEFFRLAPAWAAARQCVASAWPPRFVDPLWHFGSQRFVRAGGLAYSHSHQRQLPLRSHPWGSPGHALAWQFSGWFIPMRAGLRMYPLPRLRPHAQAPVFGAILVRILGSSTA